MNAFDKSAEHSVHDRRSQTWDFLQIVQGISVRVIKDQFPAIEHIWLIEGCSADTTPVGAIELIESILNLLI